MKRFKFLCAVAVIALSAQAGATPITGSSLQNRLNDITYGDAAGTADVNFYDVQTDQVADDGAWELTATGGSFNRLIFELAGYANRNTFGIYDIHDPSNRLQIFAGSAGAGAISGIVENAGFMFEVLGGGSAAFSSSTFGYYLSGPGGTFFSQDHLNAAGGDQMVAFQGQGDLYVDASGHGPGLFTSGEFILAWEDLVVGRSDRDYNDFVVMVESVTPVPAPATLALLGLGLLGLGASARRRRSV